MDKKLAKYFNLLKEESEATRRGSSAEVSDIIEDISTLTSDLIDEADISFAVAAVFDEDSGILSAVEILLPSRDRAAAKAKDNCLTFLAQFISRIGKRALAYAPLVKAKCMGIFRREDSRSVQAAALTPLLSILESSMQESIPLDFSLDWTWAESLLIEYRKARTAATLRSNILILIGYAVEKFPALFQEEHLDIILKICLDTLEEELHRTGNNPVFVLVTGAIRCLDSLLLWFDRTVPAGGSVENSRKIYAYIEQVLHFREDLKRYEMVKAGLRLFSRHASLFRLRLLENSMVVLKWLQSYCTHGNAQLRDAAFPAFEQFISEIVSCIISDDQRAKNSHQTYKKIFSDALGVLDSPGSDPKLTSLAILTVGKLSPLIVKFSGKGSLLQTFYRLVPFGGSPQRDTNGREESLNFSVTLVGAFADMVVYLDEIENYTVSLIAKAVGNTFHGFPYMFPKQRYGLYASLQRLFKALYSHDAVFTVFLNNIVWSSLERAMGQDDGRELGAPLWKHYVELWSQLLMLFCAARKGHGINEINKENIPFSEPSETSYGKIKDANLQASIFDCLLKSIMKAMVELNLKYRVKSSQVHELGNAAREQDLATDALGNEGEEELIEPLDPLQMRKFLNLVEFVQEFLSRDFVNLFLKWIYPFGRFLVELSSQYPLISGFYKLLAISIHKAEEKAYFGELESLSIMKITCNENEIENPLAEDSMFGESVSQQDRDLCKNLFRKYLQEVLVASKRYKLELFASCLHLCLSAPPPVMDIEYLVAPTISALKIGLRHFPLAMVAINSLENWHRLHPEKLEPWLPHIIPYLNPYLVQSDSREVITSTESRSISGASRFSSSRIYRKNARVTETHATQIQVGSFEHIRLHVQKFLGKIGGQSHLLVPDINLLQVTGVGGLAWDTRDQVRFNLPLRDIKPDIWLDSLLLRIVELSTSASDRQAKIVASELLHAICLVMLGNAAKGPVRREGQEHQSVHYEKIYRRLFPAILQLATDMELVTRQLFSVFVKQLIHWFTSNTQKENPDSMALLDSILDGVVDADNGSLREFCAECFAEFMRWSVRHVSVEVDNFVNIASMLHRLYTRLDHPNAYHRLGAAMACHLIYPVLRENASIVDCHILEMVFFCIKSLRVGENDNDQIGTMKQMGKVLEGIQRLIRRNITILLKGRKDRRMFLNIDDFLDWLFLQTGRSEEKCRKKCMWLFNSLSAILPVGSSANWFKSKVKNVQEIKNILRFLDTELRLPDLNSDKCTADMLEIWMKKLICCLQWFEWALKGQLVSLYDIVLDTGEEIFGIGAAINDFLQKSFWDTYHNLLEPLTPLQKECHGCLRVKTILELLKFLEAMLYVEPGIKEQDVEIPEERMKTLLKEAGRIHQVVPFNEPHFQNLIFDVLFHPPKITYSLLESQSLDDLVRQTMKIIKMLSFASSVFKESFIHLFRSLLSEGKIKLDINFLCSSEHTNLVNLMYILKGYQQLHQVGLLLPALGKDNKKSTGQKLLNSLLSLQQPCPPALQPVALEILTLAIALGVTASQLLELVLDHKRLGQSGSMKSVENSAGSQFYFNFRNVIVQQVKFSYKECLSILLQEAVKHFTARLILIAVLDDYLKRESITKSSFLREYLKHIQLLSPCCHPAATLSDKLFFLEMLHKLFMLDTSCDTVLEENQPYFNFIIESYFLLFNSVQLVPELGATNLLQRKTVMTVKSNALVIVPFFLKYAISNKFLVRLVDTITNVVADHLLVRETDIPQGSNERVAYIDMLQRLEDAILMANRLELLEIIFPLFQSHVKLARKKAQEILESYAEIVDENRGLACDHCLKMLNDFDKVASLRRAVFDYMFVPMINKAPAEFIVGWYEHNIIEFKQKLDKREDTIQSTLETEQDYLVVRICHYKMVELLFNRVDVKTVKDRITPIVSNQLLMQHATSDSRGKNDPAAFPFPENIILWRELHIAAYNCLAEIVMRTQDQEKLYAVLFKDFPGKPLWQNIVDCSKVYNSFPVETSTLKTSYLAVKSLQSERRNTKRSSGVSSLSSQYIVGATLTDEPALINTFLNDSQKRTGDEVNVDVKDDDSGQAVAGSFQVNDLNTDQDNEEEVVEKEKIDHDDFDRHPSMGIILRLIEHCQQKFSVKLSNDGMPEWMKSLYATLANVVTPINVCLFIAKIISKARKVFAPFASTWFRPYVQVILRDPDVSGGRTFHYMLRDICITILEWNLPFPPDVSVASSFVNHLISVAAHTSKLVLQANLEVIRFYIQTWKDSISLDRCAVIRYLTIGGGNPNMNDKSIGMKRSVGLQLLGVMVASGISLCGLSDNFRVSEQDLCKALLLNVRYKLKNVYNAAAELIGMVLKHTEEGKLSIKEHMLQSPLKQILLSLFKDVDAGQFLNIIDKITIYYPPLLDSYAAMVVDLLPRIHGVFRVTALDILLRRTNSIPNLFNLIAPFLSKLLTHRDKIAQLKSLQLVSELVKDLPISKIIERVLPVLYEAFTDHEDSDCRQLYFNILIFLYKEKEIDKNELLHHHLLLGLSDDSDAVKHDLQSFWHSELSHDLCPRLVQMVNDIYDGDIEDCWSQITVNLLLKLCEESVDFERPVFNAPLSDCEFHEYTINTSWLGGTLPLTPLFSETQTQLSNLSSLENTIQDSATVDTKGKAQSENIIRATYVPSQPLSLSQTQSSITGDVQVGSSLFALSKREGNSNVDSSQHGRETLVDKGTTLKRRILHSSLVNSQAKINAINAARRRQSQLMQQSLERANKVQMMRKYRIGELPDIEIAYKDIIIPLSVLAEKDNVFSRLVLVAFCHSMYSLHPDDLHKAEHELKHTVRDGIEAALKRTRNGASFVGCAMDICLETKESWIEPKIIGSASQKSRNFHTGILLLENAILYETPADDMHKGSKKRHCGPTRKVRKENFVFEAWLELVKLYESIGEHDVVLSIYRTSLTKAVITGRALESQLYGDSNKALQLYDNAINQFEGANTAEGIDITSVEQDLWYNQRLQCLVDLNRWQDIMEDTLLQINKEASEEPDFQTLWSPGIQDPYLHLFIKGSLKLPTYSSLLSDFVQDALDNATKRELLYYEFSVELATLALLNDQFDLAKFYIQKGFDSFINHWSSIHPLATVSRHLLVRKLQRIVEVDEFVEMIPITSERVQLQSLLALWRNRWPTSKFDDVEAWDDILQNRLLYIQKSQDLLRKCGDNSAGLLAADLGSEQACIFFEAARGLMRQGSYDAAQGYMNQYMAVIEGSTKTEKLDFKFFKALVKLRCLQADRESTVNSYEAIKMLQQVREYVTTTAQKQKYQTQTQWQAGLKLLKGDVTSQLARVSLKVLALDHTSSRAVENCVSLLSSAYMAYSGLLGEVASNGHSEKDNLFSPKRLAKVFLKLAFFCDELLTSTKDGQWGSQIQSRIKEGNPVTGLPHSSVYPSVIVKYIMKAVQLDNSMQVQHGLARVLTMLGHYKETHSEFRAQMKGTPCWLFIAWIPQMLAVVDRDEGEILVGLLEEIAQYYPQALYFPFNVSRSDFGTLGQEKTKRLEILLSNPIMKGFTRALEDLTFPEQRLRNGLTRLKSLLSVGDKKGAQRAFDDIFEDCLDVTCMMDDNRKSGEYNLKFARDYSRRILKALGENGGKLKSMGEEQFTKAVNDVMINLTKSQKNLQVGKMSLSSLSKWMADFDGSYSLVYEKEEHGKALVEIPGIYSSFKKPEPSTHVKLLSFDQTLQSLSSKQRPKILKMRGSDEQDYKFVVKGGEDLRLDQRIEQLFGVMNTVLLRDSSCARRKLSLRTYDVIPISKQCGIMQFVEGTTVLEDVIKDGLMDRLPCAGQQASRQGRNTPKDLLMHLRSQYHEWIDKKGASKDVSECYRNMYRNVGADEVIQKMNSLISQLPWDALKIGISRLSTSAESFLALRSQFVRSLSVVSICGYIAGIGDRHLSNFLMDTTNGMLVPIDFGYSFGTGVILLPVPELIPFRLTSQFINLLLPLDSIGLLRNDMVRTLSALHANREIISAVLDIFVNEPLVDWKSEAMKTAALQQPEFSGSGSESQPRQVSSHEQKHVALKVENAHRKLNFWNPADITVSELHSSVHFNKPYLSDLEKLVRGNPEHNVRAHIQRTVCESIQEQVDCLIDQATDLNLLGRIWVGWQPWL